MRLKSRNRRKRSRLSTGTSSVLQGGVVDELGQLLGVRVDVLTPNALPDSFRAEVLTEARVL